MDRQIDRKLDDCQRTWRVEDRQDPYSCPGLLTKVVGSFQVGTSLIDSGLLTSTLSRICQQLERNAHDMAPRTTPPNPGLPPAQGLAWPRYARCSELWILFLMRINVFYEGSISLSPRKTLRRSVRGRLGKIMSTRGDRFPQHGFKTAPTALRPHLG